MIEARKSEPALLNPLKRLYRFLTSPPAKLQGIRIFKSLEGSVVYQPALKEMARVMPPAVRSGWRQPDLITNPFMCVKDDVLYCFFGTKNRAEQGKIGVLMPGTDNKPRVGECCLNADCHVSFPFIYASGQDKHCFMIPETSALREVALYEPIDFPLNWIKTKVLLTGHFIDSHLLFFEGTFYLFTTQVIESTHSNAAHYQLNIYYSDTPAGDYTPHPCNPVCTDQKYSRSGGKILLENGIVYRIARDCSRPDSGELHFLRIAKLSRDAYEEEFWLDNWATRSLPTEAGAYHIDSLASSRDVYTAVEVSYKDSYLQRFADLIRK